MMVESDESKIVRYLHSLIRGNDISFDEKSEIIQSLHDNKVREVVAEFLKGINSPKLIENP